MFSYIRKMLTVLSIRAMHRIEPQLSPLSSVVSHPLKNLMFDALKTADGPLVHWGAYQSGKSTAAREAALRLQECGHLVILLHGYDRAYKSNMHEWLAYSILGASEPTASDQPAPSLATILNTLDQPVAIIIDHFDVIMASRHNVREWLRDAAVDIRNSQKCSLLLIVTSWENAKDLQANGAVLIGQPGCGRWKQEELSALLDARFPECSAEERARMLRIATLAGCPGLVGMCKAHDESHAFLKRAELVDAEWRNGISALKGEACGVGRFPDKRLLFHWD